MIHPIENWRTLDDKGIMMPWYTRPALEWLDKQNLRGKLVFEYGCGASSLWYLSRGCVVNGVDTKREWCFHGQKITADRQAYTFLPNIPDFDIIAIDGDFRDDCTEFALRALRSGGFLIIDNYKQATADLLDWPKTDALIKNMDQWLYKEESHEDWKTLIVRK